MNRNLVLILFFICSSITAVLAADSVKPEPKIDESGYYKYQKEQESAKDAALEKINEARKKFQSCLKKNNQKQEKCLDELNEIDNLETSFNNKWTLPDSPKEKRCDQQYDTYNDEYKECRSSYERMKDKCTSKSDLGLIDNDTLQATAPLMSMVSGADAILDIYGAMSENPQCTLSREDFKQERDSIKDDIKDIENQISDKTKEMQEAQEKYTEKLNDWADREREILDELNKIPIEKEKNRRKLDDQKVKMKIEAESKYVSVTEQINTLTAEYSSIIQDQKAAVYQSSDFAMYDTCNMEYEKRAKAAGTVPTANGLSGAYYSGNLKKTDKVNYMANCLKVQRQNAKRVETAFVNKLNAIKNKIESMDRMRGQIEEERKLADKAIADEMKDLEYDAESKATSLRNEYQGIQQKKQQEQALLNQKLQTLSNEISSLKRKASVLSMRMQHYSTKTLPKSSDKSVEALISDCEGFDSFKNTFTSMCCSGEYQGKGKSLCSGFKPRETKPTRGSGKAKKSQ